MIEAIFKYFGFVKQDDSFGQMMDQLQQLRDDSNKPVKFIGYVELNEMRKAGQEI